MASNRHPRMVLVSELYHPGWRATAGDDELPIVRANWALQGIPLAPGDHEVTLAFQPPLWIAGLVVQGIALLSLLGLAGFAFWRRRSRAASAAEPASG